MFPVEAMVNPVIRSVLLPPNVIGLPMLNAKLCDAKPPAILVPPTVPFPDVSNTLNCVNANDSSITIVFPLVN